MTLGGGMAVQKAVADRWEQVTGKPLIEAYGLTETSPAATINPLDLPEYNGAIGLPISSTDLVLRDDDGKDVALGERGEICVRGPQVMAGYWQRPEETAKIIDRDGWLATGDIGVMDERGFVRIVDRKKDMHCDRAVAALESYIGLVEAGVGLLPAGGGSKELAVRAAQEAARGANGSQLDQFPFLRTYFQQVATATVSKSALDARDLGYLRPSDVVIFNPYELLWVAKAQVGSLSESAYRPPLPARNIPVAGKTGIATLEMMLVNMRDGGFVSAYDFEIGLAIARVLCGGELESGSLVDENWFLTLERREFMNLLRNAKTQERVAHTLKTGKPLRN